MIRALSTVALLALLGCSVTAPAERIAPAGGGAEVSHGTDGPAAAPVEYEIAFPNAEHHEAEVTVTFRDLPAVPLEVRLSRTSPGRYALHEFAKNVYSVRATDGAGRELPITRPDPHQWDVGGHDGTVVFSYTLFGDRTDGTYAGIDNTHAHLNIPATFAWARGLEERPVSVRFQRPDESYRIATQLVPTADPETFTAPDLQYFMDSPTELSRFELRSWEVPGHRGSQTVRLAVHHLGTEAEVDRFAEMVKAVVAEEIAVFGEAPTFDHGTYTFIADYLPWSSGDGMEHRNSTILTSSRPLSTGALANLGTVSHEFVHAWNVERIRPRSLEPFDFERANMSGELWFAEGFTSYYTPLVIVRAGITGIDDYARSLTGTLETVINSPGRRYFSPVEMSLQAPFVDAAVSVDPTNRGNTFISYYTWGAAIGLGLDLLLRAEHGLTLDDYMRAVWEAYGEPERPYTRADLRETLARLTGDAAFADRFFERYIEGSAVVDYRRLLAQGGLLLRPARPGGAWIGDARLAFEGEGIVVESATGVGTPLYEAGIDRGDLILSIDGTAPGSVAELEALLAARSPGDVLGVVFLQRGDRRTSSMRIAEDPSLEVVTYEAAGLEVTDAIRSFREDWLGSRSDAR